jgi:hypothetical protein
MQTRLIDLWTFASSNPSLSACVFCIEQPSRHMTSGGSPSRRDLLIRDAHGEMTSLPDRLQGRAQTNPAMLGCKTRPSNLILWIA